MLQALTSTQQTKHWKNRSAIGAWKLKLLRVALFSSTIPADAAGKWRVSAGFTTQMTTRARCTPARSGLGGCHIKERLHSMSLTCTVC